MILNFRILLFALIIPVIFGGGGVLFGLSIVGKGPLTQQTDVVVDSGIGIMGTADALKNANVISNRYLFAAVATATGNKNKIKAGEYEFPAQISLWHVIQKLARGEVVVRKLTFPEGWTSKQIVALIQTNEFLAGDITEIPAEGSLMPDTYTFTRNDQRSAIIARMQKAMTDFTTTTWQNHAPDYPLNQADWIKLASITEAETPKPDERPRVAGVYMNRIVKHMLLEADPTVTYGLNDGAGPLGRSLTFADLKNPHAFNTYIHEGLPPTPINNPGRASLLAALTPEKHDYLFFVADGTGGHQFAATYAEHQKNVANWRKQESSPVQKPEQQAVSPH